MEERENGNHGDHGGMDHGMGMMLLGCGIPMVAIALLPRLGVSVTASIIIGVVAMAAAHGGMTVYHRLKTRLKGRAEAPAQATHH